MPTRALSELNIILGFGEVISVGDNLGEEIFDF